MNTYPLTPVVTTSNQLSEVYNNIPQSHQMLSSCIKPEECAQLLKNGASFDQLIIVDGAGKELLAHIGAQANWNAELMPTVHKLSLTPNNPQKTAHEIHTLIMGDPNKCGMG